MAEGRRQGRGAGVHNIEHEEENREDPALDPSVTEMQRARIRLRQRWELASVLNFLGVFCQLIPDDLRVSAEEIEAALISPNEDLGRIHIALLKGIPPVSKNMQDKDAWISCVCKKLTEWWSWVAEGENPVKADRGMEVQSYRQLEPTTRLLILKALCEIRAEQDDILIYITDEIKKGTDVNFFRKERIGSSGRGTIYWYDGNPVIGHRLYREIRKDYSNQKVKGKGRAAQPTFFSQWETIATNLEEFREISEILSSSMVQGEAFVGETVKSKILPVLEEIEKKKERALKRKQRQALHLECLLSLKVGATRSCRERRPVQYTFDDYDRAIDEAISITNEPTISIEREEDEDSGEENSLSNGITNSMYERLGPESSLVHNNAKKREILSDDDDDDYNGDNDEMNGYDLTGESDSDREKTTTHSKSSTAPKHTNVKLVAGLRRSSRLTGLSNSSNFDARHAATKKRLRQRPTQNADYIVSVISDSEDEKPAKSFKETAADLGCSDEPSAATSSDGLQEESGEEQS